METGRAQVTLRGLFISVFWLSVFLSSFTWTWYRWTEPHLSGLGTVLIVGIMMISVCAAAGAPFGAACKAVLIGFLVAILGMVVLPLVGLWLILSLV